MANEHNQNEVEVVYVDEVFAPQLSVEQIKELTQIQLKITKSYLANKDKIELHSWLNSELNDYLPGKSQEEIAQISDDLISSVKRYEDSKKSLYQAKEQRCDTETWFVRESRKATAQMSVEQTKKFLFSVDNAITKSNEALYNTVYNQNGQISMNPNLDGFIAEQYHVNTFNEAASLNGSKYRARVCEPDGAYRKNSVDVVIYDTETGKIEGRYQFKYCKDAKSTEKAFEHGDYRGQGKLVPEGQSEQISKKSHEVIEAPDGTKSKPLSKEKAKSMQEQLQEEGKLEEHDWSDFDNKELLKVIAKKSASAALMGAASSTGAYIVDKIYNDEDVECKELAKQALKGAAYSGLAVAAGAAIKVAVEKDIISLPEVDTQSTTIDLGKSTEKLLNNTFGKEDSSGGAGAGDSNADSDAGGDGKNDTKWSDFDITPSAPPPMGPTVPIPPRLTNIICGTAGVLSVDNAMICSKLATGDLTLREAGDAIVENVAAAQVGAQGAAIGAKLGSSAAIAITTAAGALISAPVSAALVAAGAAVGAFAGRMIGAKVGRSVAKGLKKVREKVTSAVKSVGSAFVSGVKSVASAAGSAISSFCSGIRSLFSW